MATREDIKKAILAAAGNPDSGVVAEMADVMADAVYELDNPKPKKDTKEIRVDKPEETR